MREKSTGMSDTITQSNCCWPRDTMQIFEDVPWLVPVTLKASRICQIDTRIDSLEIGMARRRNLGQDNKKMEDQPDLGCGQILARGSSPASSFEGLNTHPSVF